MKHARKLTDPAARAVDAMRRHPLVRARADELRDLIEEARTIADLREVVVVLAVRILELERRREGK